MLFYDLDEGLVMLKARGALLKYLYSSETETETNVFVQTYTRPDYTMDAQGAEKWVRISIGHEWYRRQKCC